MIPDFMQGHTLLTCCK